VADPYRAEQSFGDDDVSSGTTERRRWERSAAKAAS
jgi:hypothetical protein